MNFSNLVSSQIGFVHLVFSILALIFGTVVLFKTKGTLSHKRIGYVYVFMMTGVVITAFMIYRLFGKFGIFHWAAVVSTVTLIGGMLPMFLKKPKSYIKMHLSFMYWSVFGLYGAFVAETLVRIPDVVIESGVPNYVFYNMVGVGVFITMGLGYYFAFKNKKKWEAFDKG